MKFKLPKVFKRKWVAALRSGEYKQGDGQLYNKTYDKYCCLGVACAITGNTPDDDSVFIYYKGIVPDILVGSEALPNKLSRFNDSGKSFKWIASYIERYL